MTRTPPSGGAKQAGTAALVGTWDLVVPAGMRGPHLSITIDSARGTSFYGKVTRALSGDMELSQNFLPFKGALGRAGLVRFRVSPSQKGSPPTRFEGHLKDDRLRLSSFVWAGEQQVKPDKGWELRKTK